MKTVYLITVGGLGLTKCLPKFSAQFWDVVYFLRIRSLSHMARNYIGQFSFFAVSSTSLSELSDVILDKILINGWPILLEFIYRASILAKMSLKALWEMFFN